MAREGDSAIARGFDKMNNFTQKWEKRAFFTGAGAVVAGAAIPPLAIIVGPGVWLAMVGGGMFVADKATEKVGNKVLEGFRLRQPRSGRASYSVQMNHGLESGTNSMDVKPNNIIEFPYKGRTRPDNVVAFQPKSYSPRRVEVSADQPLAA